MLYQTSLSGNPRVNTTQQLRIIVIRLAIVLMLMLFNTQAIQAQTFSVIHYFTGGADGGNPYAGLTIVPSGTLYGTASEGGADFNGTVFKLNQVDSRWVLSPLYEFAGFSDGIDPLGGIVI